ncbi:TetR family transcriptional regulator [Rhodococcus triatomae]|uniref:TetR/AcrR family transcriptional regulator n=1 Tax=Rhodococcus triatomae TaxID=300028 RepID=UPI0009334D59|nr:TetR/AcrR family transcriptional regulator [Rhodococcus triatomae]QNG20932.1 TetR family transcriptional regulator [Rhodococcus triatomae]QNG23153.1 TetR family transcriptional regulator [Rhodococcus triatomae]
MPRATREQSEATAERIVRTAGAMFTTHGYGGVALEAVAAEAGVTRGAVYHHFRSKRGLFEAVLADVQHTIASRVEAAADAETDLWDGLEAGCRMFLTASADTRARRIMLVDAPAVLGWNTWRGQDAAASGRLLLDVLVALRDADELADVAPGAAAAALSGAMNEAALWIAGAEDPDDATEEAWPVVQRMIRALRA